MPLQRARLAAASGVVDSDEVLAERCLRGGFGEFGQDVRLFFFAGLFSRGDKDVDPGTSPPSDPAAETQKAESDDDS